MTVALIISLWRGRPTFPILVLLLCIQLARCCALACGQSPPAPSSEQYTARNAMNHNDQTPIRPITVSLPEERSAGEDSDQEIKTVFSDVTAGASNSEPARHSSISSDRSIFDAPIRAVSDKIGNLKNSISDAANEASDSITKAFREAGQAAASKLRDSELYLSEKFRPLADAAVRIFEKPGTTDKQRWDQLVQHVDSVGLNNADKQEFYQKLAAATNNQKRK